MRFSMGIRVSVAGPCMGRFSVRGAGRMRRCMVIAGARGAFTGLGIHTMNRGQMTRENGRVSPRAWRCYQELIRYVDQHGFVPSYAELGSALGCSTSTVSRYLDQLQAAGLIERKAKRARSIVIKICE
jgi:hypothetical protein